VAGARSVGNRYAALRQSVPPRRAVTDASVFASGPSQSRGCTRPWPRSPAVMADAHQTSGAARGRA
jgi:hypothetical protein